MREAEIKRLIALVEQSQIDELEVRRWWSTVRIARTRGEGGARGGGAVAPSPPVETPRAEVRPVASAVVAPAPTADAPGGTEAGEAQAGLVPILSPMVGTYYHAPSPTAPPYVKVGQRIGAGQVVCIIEAMKLMNEIEAEISGTLAEILVRNEQPVEFNQPLFLVRPD